MSISFHTTRVFHFIRNIIFNERIVINEKNITRISRKIIKLFTLFLCTTLTNLEKKIVDKSTVVISKILS